MPTPANYEQIKALEERIEQRLNDLEKAFGNLERDHHRIWRTLYEQDQMVSKLLISRSSSGVKSE